MLQRGSLHLIVPEYAWLLKLPFNDLYVAENAYYIMLAERNQNAKSHLQYDYNCMNHVGQDQKRLWANNNILICQGKQIRDNFFLFLTIIVLMCLLSCKIIISINDVNSYHL